MPEVHIECKLVSSGDESVAYQVYTALHFVNTHLLTTR